MGLWEYFSIEIQASGLGIFDIMSIMIGSFLPVLFLKPKTKGDALLMILSGIVVSTTLGIFVTKHYELDGKGGGTSVIFLVISLGGMFLIKSVLIFFQKLATESFITKLMYFYLKMKSNESSDENAMDNNSEVDEPTV